MGKASARTLYATLLYISTCLSILTFGMSRLEHDKLWFDVRRYMYLVFDQGTDIRSVKEAITKVIQYRQQFLLLLVRQVA